MQVCSISFICIITNNFENITIKKNKKNNMKQVSTSDLFFTKLDFVHENHIFLQMGAWDVSSIVVI